MKLSVITVTFNNFEELVQTIDSTMGLEFVENIVVNGGTCKRTKQYLENDFKGLYISEKDDGIADAFNKGLGLAKGDIVTFLNSGDYLIDKEYYKKAIDFFRSDESLNYVHSNIVFVDNLLGEVQLFHRQKTLGRGSPYFHQTLIMTKKSFDIVGSFDKSYSVAMDFDLFVRMRKNNLIGKHLSHHSVKMDGKGVSVNNELIGIRECERSLVQNGLMNFSNKIGLIQRKIFYFARRLIVFSLGEGVLLRLKALKHKQHYD